MGIIMSILTLVLGVIAWYLRKNYELLKSMQLEEFKAAKQSFLQREAYFRQLSGSDLQKTFSTWTDIIIDTSKMENSNKKEFLEMQKNIILFGSDKSIKIFSKLMQYLYSNSSSGNDDSLLGVVYIAHLISSLKYDFTGYKIEPLDLLKIRMTDFSNSSIEECNEKVIADLRL